MIFLIFLYCILGIMSVGFLYSSDKNPKDIDLFLYFILGFLTIPLALGVYLGKKIDKKS